MKTIRTLEELEEVLRQKVSESKPIMKLAQETGLTQSRLSDFKNGKMSFRLQNLNILANHFGVKFRLENWPTEKVKKNSVSG